MKKISDYLDDAIKKGEISNDYALSKMLKIPQNTLSTYRTGKRQISNYAAGKLAELLEIDPWEIVTAAEIEREKNEHRREFWAKMTSKTKCLLLAATLTGDSIEITPEWLPIAHNGNYRKFRRKQDHRKLCQRKKQKKTV